MTQSQRLKSVVVCADDYAVNAPTSQGIVALSVLGRLSATSVMVHSPRWPQDAQPCAMCVSALMSACIWTGPVLLRKCKVLANPWPL